MAAAPEEDLMTQTMTLTTLDAATADVIAELKLGDGRRTCDRSSAYHDYVALRFAFIAKLGDEVAIRRRFDRLCAECGWGVCEVRATRDGFHVTLQQSNVISFDDATFSWEL